MIKENRKVVDLSDLTDKEKNPTRCLQIWRYLGECENCGKFKYHFKGNIKTMKIDCNPRFSEDGLKKLQRMRELKKQKKKIIEELDELECYES